jgi:alkylation response protein AidB-like acyl-CoA dehydrogenase
VDGGWRVSGGSPFASGCHHTPWYGLAAIEVRDGEPVLDPDTGAPQPFVIILPRRDATITDSWHTVGMRGTGSATIGAEDLFVPDHRTWQLPQLASPHPSFDHPYLRMWPMVQVHGESIVSVGVAASAVEALVELAGTKTASYTTAALRDRELIQYQAGRARALVDAARAYLHTACRAAYEEAMTSPRLSDQTKVSMQLAGCFAADACAESVRLVHEAAGTSGIRLEAPFERHLRDAQTLSQHASKASPRYASAGRLLFGLPNDWIFLSF